jgi:hypothetical protein
MVSDVSAQVAADELRAAERKRVRSLLEADVETARRIHADDFQLINPLGGSVSKDQYLGDRVWRHPLSGMGAWQDCGKAVR